MDPQPRLEQIDLKFLFISSGKINKGTGIKPSNNKI